MRLPLPSTPNQKPLVQEALDRAIEEPHGVCHCPTASAQCAMPTASFSWKKGTVLESGTHEELLSYDNRYAQFYTQQFKGS